MLRDARRDEVGLILGLIAEDQLGAARERPDDLAPYLAAFDAIAADPDNRLLVWEEGGEVLGCLQLTFIPGLSRRGAWRAQIEAVRVARARRGGGIGARMMQAAVALARERGCSLVQLTTDKRRPEAHRFYARLGFVASHEGMKLPL